MRVADCGSRRTVEGDSRVFFCSHPKMHAPGNLVTAEICKICRCWQQPPPDWFRPFAADRSAGPCIYLGEEVGLRDCPTCRGAVRRKVFACGHILHRDTTLGDCRNCADFEPRLGLGGVRDWAVGVTTAARKEATLGRRLQSLAAAGWEELLAFAAAGCGDGRGDGLPVAGPPPMAGPARLAGGAFSPNLLLLPDSIWCLEKGLATTAVRAFWLRDPYVQQLKGVSLEASRFRHVHVMALMVASLSERKLRQAMRRKGLPSLPIYPENRACASPTMFDIVRLFRNVERYEITAGDDHHIFPAKLTEAQRQVLNLLEAPVAAYQ